MTLGLRRGITVLGHSIHRERPGLISHGPCWVIAYGAWLHAGECLPRLLLEVACEYRSDKHLVG